MYSHGRRQQVAGGRAAARLFTTPCPRLPPPVVVVRKKIICALSTLPVHCRSVNFTYKSTKCFKTLHSQY